MINNLQVCREGGIDTVQVHLHIVCCHFYDIVCELLDFQGGEIEFSG